MMNPGSISHDATELTLNRIVKNVAILGPWRRTESGTARRAVFGDNDNAAIKSLVIAAWDDHENV
jgi:hypothetical protein